MLTLDHVLESMQYRIVSGEPYGWRCYGEYAYQYELHHYGTDDCVTTCYVIFDLNDRRLYEITIGSDSYNAPQYAWWSGATKDKHKAECVSYGLDPKSAGDDVLYVELDELSMLTVLYNVRASDGCSETQCNS